MRGTNFSMHRNRQRARQRPVGYLLAAFAAGLTACAGTGSGGADGFTGPEGSTSSTTSCIFSSTIRDFTALDNQNLILDGPGRRAYHVELASPAFSLESEIRIGVVDRDGDGRICAFSRDRILVDGPLAEELAIRRIRQIGEADVAELRIQFGIDEAPPEDLITVIDVE